VSLGIVVKAPEGLVLAAESRLTLQGENRTTGEKFVVSFDNATKLLAFGPADRPRSVAAVTYGQAAIGSRTAAGFLPEFEAQIGDDILTTEEFSKKLSDFYVDQWRNAMPADYSGPNMTFVVGGYDRPNAYGRVFIIEIPANPQVREQNAGDENFGITWGGQSDFMDRLLRGYDRRVPDLVAKALKLTPARKKELEAALLQVVMPLPLAAMPLQDCVDLAVFFIRTTIAAQSLTIGNRGVGGPIDVATITRSRGLEFIKRKQIQIDER